MNAGIQHKLDELHDMLNDLDSIFANIRRADMIAEKNSKEMRRQFLELNQEVSALERYRTDHDKLISHIEILTKNRKEFKTTLQGVLSAVKALGTELRQQG